MRWVKYCMEGNRTSVFVLFHSSLVESGKCRISDENYPENRMLGHRAIVDGKAGKYVWRTSKQIYDEVFKMGESIRSCGVDPEGQCDTSGVNCPEWIMSVEACNAHAMYCVPLYDTLGAGAVEFIINHAEVSIAFSEEKKVIEVLKTFPNTTNFLKTIMSLGEVTTDQKQKFEKFGVVIYEFLQLGDNKQFEIPIKKKEDICTIMYTSGTTGYPKGVMISYKSSIPLIAGGKKLLPSVKGQLTEKDVYLSSLPLAHIFYRVIEELFIYTGASIGFWRGDVKLLVEDIGELKPTIFCVVPRVLDRIYNGFTEKIAKGGLLKSALFTVAYSYKQHTMQKGSTHEDAARIFDKIVFGKVKQGLGGNVRLILSGAAPLANHGEAYLQVVTCAHVLQGYGLTETCAGTFVSLPNEPSMLGTVGPLVPKADVCFESVPVMGYDANSSTSLSLYDPNFSCFTGTPNARELFELMPHRVVVGWLAEPTWLIHPSGIMVIVPSRQQLALPLFTIHNCFSQEQGRASILANAYSNRVGVHCNGHLGAPPLETEYVYAMLVVVQFLSDLPSGNEVPVKSNVRRACSDYGRIVLELAAKSNL